MSVARAIAGLALACAACSGDVGTLQIAIATAPGSTVLDSAQTLRLTITSASTTTSPTVYTIERTDGHFDLSVDLAATQEAATLLLDAFDAQDQLVATGASPAFALGPVEARIVIYMAAPNSIGAAPVKLAAPVSLPGAAALSYGAVFAGGTAESGAPTDTLTIYNAFDHSMVAGMPLPAPRAQPAIGVGVRNIVYLFGGLDTAGAPTDTFWRFDTAVAPNGAYADFGSKPGFARAGEALVPIGDDKFLLTGAPVGEASGIAGTIISRTEVASLPPTAVTLLGTDGKLTSIFVGSDGVVRFRDGAFDHPDIPAAARTGHAVVTAPGGKVLVVCGGPDALRIDAATASVETFANIPRTPRTGCAAATTRRHLLIVGGTGASGDLADAELYDLTTLSYIATIPLAAPRVQPIAIALPNDQVLIAGGTTPTDLIELFTPAR